MFFSIVQKQENDDLNDENEAGMDILKKDKKNLGGVIKHGSVMKNKVIFMSKVLKMQRLLREERESILKIKAMNNNKLPQGILLDGKEALESFTAFKKVDSHNEKRPY